MRLCRSVLWMPVRSMSSQQASRPPRILIDNSQSPKWESGQIKVLKPQFRLHARKLKFAIEAAESLGYVVLRSESSGGGVGAGVAAGGGVYPPVFKSVQKEARRVEGRKAKIAKALEGMDKRRAAMHKKDREDRYAAKMKGINKYFPERRHAPLPKGLTHYKKRRAIGNG